MSIFHLHNTWISRQSENHEVFMIKVSPQNLFNLTFFNSVESKQFIKEAYTSSPHEFWLYYSLCNEIS